MSGAILAFVCHLNLPNYSGDLRCKQCRGLSKIKTAGYIQSLAERRTLRRAAT